MGRKRRASCLAALVLAGVAAQPTVADATWPGKPGRIAYGALSAPDDGIYSVRPDGTASRWLIPGAETEVAWSRDGSRIAYFRTNVELWEARSNGSHARLVRRLTGGAYGRNPAWSPSGRQLVFTLAREHEGNDESITTTQDVYVVRRDGKGLRKLVRGHDPTWSSRNRIAYAGERGDVFTIRPTGRGRHIWVPQGSPVYVKGLDFSPDGHRLVYQQDPSTRNGTIRTIDLRNRRQTQFSDFTDEVRATDVSWAPGGRRLAYLHATPPAMSGPAPPYELRTISPSGRRPRTLFKFLEGASVFDFAWQTR